MLVEVITWMFFTLAIAVLPLVFNRILNKSLIWKDFWSDGQVLLIGIALGAEAIAEIMSTGIDGSTTRSVVAGMTFLSVISCCFIYPSCFDEKQRSQLLFPAGRTSFVLFFLSLITSICCKIISHS